MKIVKYLFFLLLIVVIGGAVYFGTKDGSFDIKSTKTLQAPVGLVFEKANDYTTWKQWGPWMETDPNMEVSYGATTQGEGASYSWKSETEGNGTMKTLAVAENDSLVQQITFNTPMGDSSSEVYWYFSPAEGGSTEVTWGMRGEQSFMEKVFMAFQADDFDAMLKTMFDRGLNRMDELVQNEMNEYSISVEGIKEYGGGYYMFTTTASRTSEVGEKMGPMLGKVMAFMEQNNIQQTGMPFSIYNEWDETNGTTIFSAAIPVKERIIVTEGDVLCGYMEPLSAVKTVLTGNYTHLQKAYEKAEMYISENSLLKDPAHKPFEIYANDPGNFPNPADWKTEIYIPVFKDLTSNHPIIEGNLP